MTTKKQHDRVGTLIKEVEGLAKRLRTDLRKRAEAAGFLKNLKAVADQLRKRAAMAAAQVEKYVHEIRKELEAGAKPAKRAKPKRRKVKVSVVPPASA
jgi:hypothetical protein